MDVQVALVEQHAVRAAGQGLDLLGSRTLARVHERRRQFVAWAQLRQVLAVLVPAALYVLLVQFVGLYVASALYIALFMVWLGHYSWLKSVAVALVVSVSLFVMFEIWFKVPLWKGTWDLLSWTGY